MFFPSGLGFAVFMKPWGPSVTENPCAFLAAVLGWLLRGEVAWPEGP